jgi:hypothetical protein
MAFIQNIIDFDLSLLHNHKEIGMTFNLHDNSCFVIVHKISKEHLLV